MTFGWDLPPGVTDRMIEDAQGGDHHPACPQHEDADEVYECGGHNEHFCSIIEREINGCEIVEPDCKCYELDASDKADAAEYKRDAREDR